MHMVAYAYGSICNPVQMEEKLKRVVRNVNRILEDFELKVEDCEIEKRDDLGNNSLASWEHPNKILVKSYDVPESVIAHELVHVLQGTLETFAGFKYLYTLPSEGLAEFVAKPLYPEHEIRYATHHRMVAFLLGLKCGHQLKRCFFLIYAKQTHIGATSS